MKNQQNFWQEALILRLIIMKFFRLFFDFMDDNYFKIRILFSIFNLHNKLR